MCIGIWWFIFFAIPSIVQELQKRYDHNLMMKSPDVVHVVAKPMMGSELRTYIKNSDYYETYKKRAESKIKQHYSTNMRKRFFDDVLGQSLSTTNVDTLTWELIDLKHNKQGQEAYVQRTYGSGIGQRTYYYVWWKFFDEDGCPYVIEHSRIKHANHIRNIDTLERKLMYIKGHAEHTTEERPYPLLACFSTTPMLFSWIFFWYGFVLVGLVW